MDAKQAATLWKFSAVLLLKRCSLRVYVCNQKGENLLPQERVCGGGSPVATKDAVARLVMSNRACSRIFSA